MAVRILNEIRPYVALALVAAALLVGCKEFLPEDLQEEEFAVSTLDERACEYLTRPLILSDTTYNDQGEVVSVTFDTLYMAITSTYNDLAAELDSLIIVGADTNVFRIGAIFDSLSNQLDTLVMDTTLSVSYPAGEDTSYTFYYHPTPQGGVTDDVFFFVSWRFVIAPALDNTDDFVAIDLIRRDGTLVSEKAEPWPPEAVAGCSELVTIVPSGEEIIPKVRTRVVFELDEAPYLVRFAISETNPGEIGSFRIAILQAE